MPFQSRWTIDIPNCHLATLLFTSPTHPLSQTRPCFLDAARPDTHYFTEHAFRLWSQRFAAGLRRAGLQRGDRVLLFSGNDLFFPVVFMGIIMAGGIFTGANPTFVARELEYQLRDSEATFLICAMGSLATGVQAARGAGLGLDRVFVFDNAVFEQYGADQGTDRIHKKHEEGLRGCRYWGELIASAEEGSRFVWEDLMTPGAADTRTLALNYSSGTTGRPKGVEITHKNYVANLLQYNFLFYLYPDWVERVARARWLCFLPMYHAMAQNIFIAAALRRGVPVYIMPKFDMLTMLEYTEKFRITDYIIVPPVVVALAKHPAVRSGQYDLSSVEGVFSGAAPLGAEVCEQVEKLWAPGQIKVRQGWGMTETTCSLLGWDPRMQPHPASVGELNANCEAKIMADDDKTELGPNQRGELWVRGQNIMKGYWKNPGATKEAKTEDGWLKTGDIAFVNDQGLFHVVDRKKELIKVKGNQVAPAELEAILLDHPAVADAAVIGVPLNDDERPRAYIVLNSGQTATKKDILSFMDGKVSPFKRITGGVVFIDAIPKNPSGKILRKMLRERANAEIQPTARL
ncbi:acyl--CoA ligase [Aspergillus homomorphus CBS 101889]|uniref:Putative 4-coumarate-CoA ligase n=1 Tax=Aspergillus homomorphus (strain CBS 101889) TaxID=1450537 RepID=A0A395HHS6_ASPHC|nr:putative 4-coumarate-CoA ligase [Aspergillus homomorphus CBS 101889]RAL07176.1 putative 4-coumarate-CoA ligase [Aspergillus homomorphus CBS 101889]